MSEEQTPSGETGPLYRFAEAEFDELAHELRVNGQVVTVEAKALGVLACLLARPAETLTKDELLEAGWPGRIVSEGTLTKAVMKLRAVLGDERQTLIRTVHGFGYRLAVPVERLSSDAPARFLPAPGQTVPFRANWRLVEALDPKRRGMVWLAEHAKTRQRRVFKFADGPDSLVTLKREITLYRLLHDSLGAAAPVVQIFDWNLDEPPYFTESEWIEGGDLEQWLGQQAVGLTLRLEAMAQICEAVAATHALGMVHKDLKPGNVLVRSAADHGIEIRLADFGIGALTDAAAIEALGITQLGFTRTRGAKDSSSGTPLYLAPEVIGGQVPTQRSDIYALGVMLYQAIVADPRKPLAPGWRRDVDDELLREDIAAAADVDPDRRLGSAGELGRRLRRLAERRAERAAEGAARDEAVRLKDALAQARVRRQRLAWASALLLVVLSVVSVLAAQMRTAQQSARVEADTATAVNDFLIHDLLAQANPLVAGRRDVGVREVLDAAAAQVGTRFAGRPGSEAGVRLALGSAYRNLAEYESAAQQLEAAEALANTQADAARFADPLALELAALRISQDRPGDARPLLEPLLDSMDEAVAAQAAITLARAEERAGDFEQSMRYLERVSARAEAGSPLAASALGQKGLTLIAMGRYGEAVEVNREHLAAKRRLYGSGDIRTLDALRSTALSLYYAERFDEALAVNQEAHRLAVDVLGPDHDQTLVVAADVALLHQELGDLVHAEALMRATLETRTALYGEDSRDARTLLNNLGVVYGELGQRELELDFLRRAWQADLRATGESHPDTLVASHNVGRALLRMGRHVEAESIQRRTAELALDALGPEHPYIGIMNYILAEILAHLGQFDEAEQRIADAISLLEATLGADNSFSQRARNAQATIRQLREQAG